MNITCAVARVPRLATPEERVRQKVCRALLEEHGYTRSQIEVELPVRIGSSDRYVDIAVFPPGVAHRQENATIIIECKRHSLSDGQFGTAVAQLKSYMAASVNARFGLATDGQRKVLVRRSVRNDGSVALDETSGDLPKVDVAGTPPNGPRTPIPFVAALVAIAFMVFLSRVTTSCRSQSTGHRDFHLGSTGRP